MVDSNGYGVLDLCSDVSSALQHRSDMSAIEYAEYMTQDAILASNRNMLNNLDTNRPRHRPARYSPEPYHVPSWEETRAHVAAIMERALR